MSIVVEEKKKRSYDPEAYQRNKKNIAASQRRYYKRHRDEIRERNRAHYERNREKRIAQVMAWEEAHRDQVREGDRDYYRRNVDRRREQNRRSREKFKERNNARARVRYALKCGRQPDGMDLVLAEWLNTSMVV